jgi:hypothetical protein
MDFEKLFSASLLEKRISLKLKSFSRLQYMLRLE